MSTSNTSSNGVKLFGSWREHEHSQPRACPIQALTTNGTVGWAQFPLDTSTYDGQDAGPWAPSDHSHQFSLDWTLSDLDLVTAATVPDAVQVPDTIAIRRRGPLGKVLGHIEVRR